MKAAVTVRQVAGMILLGLGLTWQAWGQGSTVPLYGIYSWSSDLRSHAAAVTQLGLRWSRVGGSSGNMISDQDMTTFAQNGINVSYVLYGYATDTTAWRTYVRNVVQKFGKNGTFWSAHPAVPNRPVMYYEVWNEPNIAEFLVASQGMQKHVLYYNMLRIAWQELKAADSSHQVISMNMAGGSWQGNINYVSADSSEWKFYSFIKAVNRLGGAAYYDVIGLHPYTTCGGECGLPVSQVFPPDYQNRVSVGVDSVRDNLALYGKAACPIWFTEVGYPIEYPNTTPISEEEQAADLIKLHVVSAAKGVQHIEIMYIVDITYSGDGSTRRFGIFDGARVRPQGTALAYMIGQLPDPVAAYRTKIDLGWSQRYRYVYAFTKPDSTQLVMYWSQTETTGTVKFRVSGQASVTDMYGAAVTFTSSGDTVMLPISKAPRYLTCTAVSGVRDNSRLAAAGSRTLDLQATPNPFTAKAWVKISCPKASLVAVSRVRIYNLNGYLVRTLAGGARQTRVEWDGRDNDHNPAPAGMYRCVWENGTVGGQQTVMKLD
jgi:hypothetical protein